MHKPLLLYEYDQRINIQMALGEPCWRSQRYYTIYTAVRGQRG